MLRSGIPIANATQDKLGRKRFSQALATAIGSYKEPSSLVVGLYGSWGTGKSSLLNMLQSDLEQRGDDLITIRFNPWNYSDQSALLQHFLSELSAQLETADRGQLKAAGKLLDDLSTVISPLSSIVPYGDVAKNVLKGIGSLLGQRAKELGTVQALKSKISAALVARNKKIIVIIDDIDRLTSDEIRQIFQLVKSVADFSNLIYVLSFDKKLVVKALADVQKGDGEAYLDKIINIPFEIPRITQNQMRSLLDAEIAKFATIDEEYPWQTDRVTQVFDAVSRQFDTIRALDRFSNVLEFTASLVKGEVDYADFIALTALQISDPSTFEFIREHAARMTFDGDEGDEDYGTARQETWKQLKTSTKSVKSIELASLVFPYSDSDDDDEENADDSSLDRASAVRDARACASMTVLERYLQLVIPEDDVPRTHIRELLAASNDLAATDTVLARLISQVGFSSVFGRLDESDLSRLDPTQVQTLLHSLMKVFLTDDPDARRLSRNPRAQRFVTRLMGAIHSETERLNVFASLLQSDVGTAVLLLVVVSEISRDRTRANSLRKEPLINDPENIATLNRLAASNLASALSADCKPDWLLVDFIRVLQLWRGVGGLAVVRKFVEAVLDKRNIALIALLIAPSRPGRKRTIADAASAIDDFVDPDVLIDTVAGVLETTREEVRSKDTAEIANALAVIANPPPAS